MIAATSSYSPPTALLLFLRADALLIFVRLLKPGDGKMRRPTQHLKFVGLWPPSEGLGNRVQITLNRKLA